MSAQTRLVYILLVLGCSACELTGPQSVTIQIQGRVINRENGTPVSATVRIQHKESDGDWVWTSYRTIVDASTHSNSSGWYELSFQVDECRSFTLEVEASGFKTFTEDRIACVDGVQTMTVYLDPGICIPALFGGCDWVPPRKISLLTPTNGAAIRQNDPTMGCAAHQYRGYGFRIRFTWTASTHAATARYRLFARKTSAQNPFINVTVSGTEYVSTRCNTFVSDANLEGWAWTVEALDAQGDPVQSSGTGRFKFSPCRLASGQSCFAG